MKKAKIELRSYKISDAEKVFKMVTNPKFKYFHTRVVSVQKEKEWIKAQAEKKKIKGEWNYAIYLNNEIVGGVGIMINRRRPYIGEIGYWVSDVNWGRGIATRAVKLAEKIGFGKLKLRRIEILMRPENKASEKVAKKNGYKREGLMRKVIKGKDNRFHDAYLYAKVK